MLLESAFGRRPIPLALICLLVLASPAFAYEYPLSSESVREAYFLGRRRDQKTAESMQQYAHHLPVPTRGPYIAEIRLDTPFAQVVEHTEETPADTAVDATQEFSDKPAVLRLHVKIYFTPSYTAILRSEGNEATLRPEHFWRDFKIRFVQHDVVPPEGVRGEPIFASSEKGMRRQIGEEIRATYRAQTVSSVPAKIEIVAPNGNIVVTTFDLSKLR